MQVADNKNHHVLYFLAALIRASWFKEIGVTFPIPEHGACGVDQLFSVAKGLSRHRSVSSIHSFRQLLQRDAINIHELTSMFNVHLDSAPEWPPGLQGFHAYHLFSAPQGVVVRAKQFQGTKFLSGKPLTWVGNDKGEPQLILPTSRPLPAVAWLHPDIQKAQQVAKDILCTPYFIRDALDHAWWSSFAERYMLPAPFSWTPPTTAPYMSLDDASADELGSLAKALDLTIADTQKIAPLPIDFSWEGPRCAAAYSKFSAAELQRTNHTELLPRVREAQLKELEERRRAAREKRRKKKEAGEVAVEDAVLQTEEDGGELQGEQVLLVEGTLQLCTFSHQIADEDEDAEFSLQPPSKRGRLRRKQRRRVVLLFVVSF